MKKFLFMAVAAIAALSSCSSDEELVQNVNNKQKLVFTATMEGAGADQRATFDATEKCAAWEENDEIWINVRKYKATSAGTTTTFTAVDEDTPEDVSYVALFPSYLYNSSAILPASITETWADGQFNMPMYAKSTTTDLSFKNLCGVLKITVKNDQLSSVKSIKVSSANCATSGAFGLNGDAAALTNPSNKENTVTVNYTAAVTTDAEGKVFYVAIPAQTYQELKIELSSDGINFTRCMKTKVGKDIVVERNKIYPFTFAHNLPITGTAKRTGDINVNWVQLWAGGPKFAEYNVGVTDNKAEDYGDYYAWSTTDIATTNWGSNWRMPTYDELQALLDNCTCTWKENYKESSVNGLLCQGKDSYSSYSIFLPAAGDISDKFEYHGQVCNYWSSTAQNASYAFKLIFSVSNVYGMTSSNYSIKQSVRAVLNEE